MDIIREDVKTGGKEFEWKVKKKEKSVERGIESIPIQCGQEGRVRIRDNCTNFREEKVQAAVPFLFQTEQISE